MPALLIILSSLFLFTAAVTTPAPKPAAEYHMFLLIGDQKTGQIGMVEGKETWPTKKACHDANAAKVEALAIAVQTMGKVLVGAACGTEEEVQRMMHQANDPRADLGLIQVTDHQKWAGMPNARWFDQQHNYDGGWCCDKGDAHMFYGQMKFNPDGGVTLDTGEVATHGMMVDPNWARNHPERTDLQPPAKRPVGVPAIVWRSPNDNHIYCVDPGPLV